MHLACRVSLADDAHGRAAAAAAASAVSTTPISVNSQ